MSLDDDAPVTLLRIEKNDRLVIGGEASEFRLGEPPASITQDYLSARFRMDDAKKATEEDDTKKGGAVNHPNHYRHPSGVEAIDVIEHMPFNTGNAVKYLWREGEKPGQTSERDMNKALWYLLREFKRRELKITVNVEEFTKG